MSPYADVSVLVPCYKCQETIHRAVMSIANQTYLPAEVILVEDRSLDGTLEKLYEIRDLFPSNWIKVLEQPQNRGPGDARNAGWDMASCGYIAFLDADDSWHPCKIERQIKWMENYPDIVLTGHRVPVIEGGEASSEPSKSEKFVEINSRFLFLIKNRLPTSSVMLRRSVKHRFEPGKRYSEDFQLWLRIFLSGGRVALSNESLAFYHKPTYGAGGLTKNLKAMKDGAKDTYRQACEEGLLTRFESVSLQIYSYMKYLRRLVLVRFRAN